jgi:hypothetical protein
LVGSGVGAAGVSVLGVGSGVGVGVGLASGAALVGPGVGEVGEGWVCPGPAEPIMIRLAAARTEPTLVNLVRRRTGKQ